MSRLTLLSGVILALTSSAGAQDPQPPVAAPTNLGSLSIAELMHVQVVGAAMHPQNSSGRARQRNRHHSRGYPQVWLPHARRSAGIRTRILCEQ